MFKQDKREIKVVIQKPTKRTRTNNEIFQTFDSLDQQRSAKKLTKEVSFQEL